MAHTNERLSNISRRRQAAHEAGSAEYRTRKQEILHIAARVFRKKGYQRTTIGDIAAAVGTDRASLYYYVASKEDIYRELTEQMLSGPTLRSETIASDGRPPADRLRDLITELMTAFDEHYPLYYLDLQEHIGSSTDHRPDMMETVAERHFQAFRKVFADGIQDGSFKSSLSPGVSAEAAIGMVCWSSRWFDPEHSRYSGAEIGTAFADFLLNGLLASS